ncbi:cation transporter [Candidatus Saccharibacteria bacterium]|nr:cation transporter [Candidatus Saccharibacteria bacterium]
MSNRYEKIVRAGLLGILLNFALVVVKTFVGSLSGATSVLVDAANNFSDILSSLVILISVKFSQKKPDREHPHGHGRIEYLAALFVGLFIFVVGIGALIPSVQLLFSPQKTTYPPLAIDVIFTTIFIKIFYGLYLKKVSRDTNSVSLKAYSYDAFADAALTFSTFIGALSSLLFDFSLEGPIGIIISAFILRAAISILSEAFADTLGRRLDDGLARKIRARISDFPEVESVRALRVHDYGPTRLYGTVKITVPDDMSARDLMILTEKIEKTIKLDYNIDLTVGV